MIVDGPLTFMDHSVLLNVCLGLKQGCEELEETCSRNMLWVVIIYVV